MNDAPVPPRSMAPELLHRSRDSFVGDVLDCVSPLRTQLVADAGSGDGSIPDVSLRVDLVARWGEIEAALGAALTAFFDEQLLFAETSRVGQAFDFTASTLKLVDGSDLQFSIALDETRARLREACETELQRLDTRLAWLMDLPGIDDDHDPLGPAALAYGLRVMLEGLGLPLDARLWLLRLLEQALLAAVPAGYARINAELAANDVLPHISAGVRGQEAQHFSMAVTAGDGPEQASVRPKDYPGVATGTGSAAVANTIEQRVLDGVLQVLTRMQRQLAEIARDGRSRQGIETEYPDLRQLTGSGQYAAALVGIDPGSVDMVCRLFDAMRSDPHLPAEVSALLGWLQIPILKLALAEPGLFQTPGHPVRDLVNAIGRIVLCLPVGRVPDSPPYQAIKAVVARIRDQFDQDVSVFSQAAAELRPYGEGMGFPGAPAAPVASRLARAYGRRVAAEADVARALGGLMRSGVPPEISRFLDTRWRECLVRAHGQPPGPDRQWSALCDAARELVWSVEPKTGADERKRLLGLLPDLARKLNAGLDLISAPQSERERFLDAVMKLQSAAMRPAATEHAAPVATAGGAAAPQGKGREEGVGWIRTAADGHDAVLAYLKPGTAQASGAEARVRAGDCLEFRLPGLAPERYYLAWSYREPPLLLFAAVDGGRLVVLAPQVLGRLMERRDAVAVAPALLLDRVLARASAGLRAPG